MSFLLGNLDAATYGARLGITFEPEDLKTLEDHRISSFKDLDGVYGWHFVEHCGAVCGNIGSVLDLCGILGKYDWNGNISIMMGSREFTENEQTEMRRLLLGGKA